MSLINDALKRATVARPRATEVSAAVPLPMTAVADTGGASGSGPIPIVLFIVGVGALLVSGGFWLKAKGTPPQIVAIAQPTPAQPNVLAPVTIPAPAPVVAIQNAAVEQPALPSQPLVAARTEATTSASSSTTDATESAPEAGASSAAVNPSVPVAKAAKVEARPAKATTANTPAELKLQAIYFRMKAPTVVINGKTLKVGDTISGAKLVSIERSSAEVEVQGARRKLVLP